MRRVVALSEKTDMDILGFDRGLVKTTRERVESLMCIINESFSNVTFSGRLKSRRR